MICGSPLTGAIADHDRYSHFHSSLDEGTELAMVYPKWRADALKVLAASSLPT
jgi:hypothetical protein